MSDENPVVDADPMGHTHRAHVTQEGRLQKRMLVAVVAALFDDSGGFVVGQVRYLLLARRGASQGGETTASPLSVAVMLDNTHFTAAALIGDLLAPWISAVIAFDSEIVTGLAGPFVASPDLAAIETLRARTWGISQWFEQLDDGVSVTLSALASGVETPEARIRRLGATGREQALLARSDGDIWTGAEVPKIEVAVLQEVLHVACGTGNRRLNLEELRGGAPWRSPEGSKWAYHVPTTDWWGELVAVARNPEGRLS